MARCCTLQVLLLVALVRLFSCEPYLRQLAASNDSNDTNSSTTTTSTGASCDSNTTNCTSPATTTSATTTTPAATTTTTSSRAVVGAPAQDDSTLIIVIAVVCSLVAMAAGSLCVYGAIAYMQSSEVENRKLVKQIDSDAAGFETYLSNVANNVQRFNHRLDKDKALKEQFEKEVTAFAKDWQKVEEDSREFLDKQYTPCLRARLELQQAKDLKRRRLAQQRRQAAELKAKAALDQQVRQKRKELDLEEKKRIKEGQPPRTPDELNALAAEAVRVGQAESGRAKSLMIGASSANLVQEEEVGCCPGFPVTSNSELRKQIKRLAELQNLHANSITQLKQLRDQVEVIKNFAHPLLNKIEVKPYSVLGTTDKDQLCELQKKSKRRS
ncbi:unnamed protein product [Symbiodinium natans]|uniref:Uncharacterized protein n=1 Tax=Symbiodinium natans TaxID=878477 RepID=A0A812JBJ4_9DINO|nr:unnamed protein product [Symbiodinium natans]